MSALERRDQIISLLCEKRFLTMEYLADMFNVSRRTIYVDIMELSLSYPIETKKGTGGGIYVADGYYRDKDYLSTLQKETLESILDKVDNYQKTVICSIIKKFTRPERK